MVSENLLIGQQAADTGATRIMRRPFTWLRTSFDELLLHRCRRRPLFFFFLPLSPRRPLPQLSRSLSPFRAFSYAHPVIFLSFLLLLPSFARREHDPEFLLRKS